MSDPHEIVRTGYDAIADRFAEWTASFETPVMHWVDKLVERVPADARVLELGCGGDNRATRVLVERYDYTGVDLSREQLARARRAHPDATFVEGDVTTLDLAPESFDAIASFFMFGHIPRGEQDVLLRRIRGWLRPGGWFLTTLGTADAQDEIEEDWLGAPMFFASFDETTNRRMLERAGFAIEEARVVPFEEPGHGLVRFMWVLARRHGALASARVKVGVVGLGTMGAGIAQIAVTAGHETVGREVSIDLAERGRATIERYLGRAVEKERMSAAERDAALSRLALTTELGDFGDCDLVIEAIVEELEAKRELFAELDRITRPEAVLATNTSALSVSEIAAATEHPERVVGMHFFNPAPVLPLVEIVRAQHSSDDAVETAYRWAEGAGKRPVRCNDTPGFVVNRIVIPLLNDCVRVLDEARVTPEDLDTALTNGAGWPMGPCALVDLVGIDVHVHASEALHAQLHEERMAPPERLVRMQREGKLGRKTGEGFYRYE